MCGQPAVLQTALALLGAEATRIGPSPGTNLAAILFIAIACRKRPLLAQTLAAKLPRHDGERAWIAGLLAYLLGWLAICAVDPQANRPTSAGFLSKLSIKNNWQHRTWRPGSRRPGPQTGPGLAFAGLALGRDRPCRLAGRNSGPSRRRSQCCFRSSSWRWPCGSETTAAWHCSWGPSSRNCSVRSIFPASTWTASWEDEPATACRDCVADGGRRRRKRADADRLVATGTVGTKRRWHDSHRLEEPGYQKAERSRSGCKCRKWHRPGRAGGGGGARDQ